MSDRAYNWCTGAAIVLLGTAAIALAPGCAATSDALDAIVTGQSSVQRTQQRELATGVQKIVANLEASKDVLTPQEKEWLDKYGPKVKAAAASIEQGGIGQYAEELLMGSGITGLGLIGVLLRTFRQRNQLQTANDQTVAGLQEAFKKLPSESAEKIKDALGESQDVNTKKIVGAIKAGL